MNDLLNIYCTVEQKMKAYSLQIKAFRKERKISQEKLALLSNVSLGSIKRFERTGNISFISLLQICQALKITISFNSDIVTSKIKLYE